MAVTKKTTSKSSTTAKKTVKTAKTATSSKEIRISGSKMVRSVGYEFTTAFPYLTLKIFPYSEKSKSTKSPFSKDTKLGDVRKKDSAGEISVNGKTLVKNLEANFEKVFGLYAQVCYRTKDGGRYYTSGSLDDMSLTQLNKHGEQEGWKKIVKSEEYY